MYSYAGTSVTSRASNQKYRTRTRTVVIIAVVGRAPHRSSSACLYRIQRRADDDALQLLDMTRRENDEVFTFSTAEYEYYFYDAASGGAETVSAHRTICSCVDEFQRTLMSSTVRAYVENGQITLFVHFLPADRRGENESKCCRYPHIRSIQQRQSR
eukprot:scaffold180056_cov14-Prasinocladus_malaysianus.AAC.1